MTDKELSKLKRGQLLELLLAQSREIDRMQEQIKALSDQVNDRMLKLNESGSIADAALKLSRVFEEAQKAADLYVENVKRKSFWEAMALEGRNSTESVEEQGGGR